MGNQTCAGLCGTSPDEEKLGNEVRSSFLQKDLQVETYGEDKEDLHGK
jgi:hypothetical protein